MFRLLVVLTVRKTYQYAMCKLAYRFALATDNTVSLKAIGFIIDYISRDSSL